MGASGFCGDETKPSKTRESRKYARFIVSIQTVRSDYSIQYHFAVACGSRLLQISLCFLSVLCDSVGSFLRTLLTTEAKRIQRLHRARISGFQFSYDVTQRNSRERRETKTEPVQNEERSDCTNLEHPSMVEATITSLVLL